VTPAVDALGKHFASEGFCGEERNPGAPSRQLGSALSYTY
jgi:hypothetical protein